MYLYIYNVFVAVTPCSVMGVIPDETCLFDSVSIYHIHPDLVVSVWVVTVHDKHISGHFAVLVWRCFETNDIE